MRELSFAYLKYYLSEIDFGSVIRMQTIAALSEIELLFAKLM